MRYLILSFSLIFCVAVVTAKNYYVSADGEDANSGEHPEEAWRSLDKVNQSMDILLPGDSVLFRKGDVFKGILRITCQGSFDHPIIFSGFGAGQQPVIDGSVLVEDWFPETGSIWKASVPDTVGDEVKNLFVDEQIAPLGRHPNDAFYTTADPVGKTAFSSDAMGTFDQYYWEGADVVVRTANWILDVLPIESVEGDQIILKEEATYDLHADFGFFLQNHKHTLDIEREWSWTEEDTIYLFAELFNPNEVQISVPAKSTGILIENASHVDICGLTVENQKETGISVNSSEYINLRNNQVKYSGTDAFLAYSSNDIELLNNRFEGAHNNGLVFKYARNITVQGNNVKNIASVAGRGLNGNLKYMGVLIDRTDNLVFQYNKVDSIGYNGISFFRSSDIRILDNAVSYTCLVKDDGGGIYTWENQKTGNEISGNIVSYTMGEREGVPASKKHKAHGIYIDDRSWDLLVENNTSAYNHDFGIYIHNARDIEISGNTLVDNNVQLGFGGGEDWPGNRVIDNTFISTDDNMLCVRMYGTYNYKENFPEFSSNLYGKFVAHKIAYQSYDNHTTNLFFDQWKEESNDEQMKGWPVPYDDSISRDDFLYFTYNAEREDVVIPLEENWRDMDNNLVTENIVISPFSSVLLVRDHRSIVGELKANQFEDDALKILPNPTAGMVVVEMTGPYTVENINIIDSKGVRINQDFIRFAGVNRYEVNMDRCIPGVYFVCVRTNGHVLSKKLLVHN